jgi:hypothetical protein
MLLKDRYHIENFKKGTECNPQAGSGAKTEIPHPTLTPPAHAPFLYQPLILRFYGTVRSKKFKKI